MRRNRHVVNVVGVSTADPASPTIVLMDYASIGNLGDLLRAGRVEAEKRRNADELLALMMQVANGMATSTLFGTGFRAVLRSTRPRTHRVLRSTWCQC